MQTKFAEISEITRISAIKLRTFASDEKAAKIRCFYCSNVGEISQARWLIETKFRGMRWNFVAKFRARSTKRNFVSAKRNIVWTRRDFASTKRNFVFQEFLADYRITVQYINVQVHVSVIIIGKRNIATIATIVERFWGRTVLFDSQHFFTSFWT